MDSRRLLTPNTVLSPPRLSDAARVLELVNDPVIAEMTLSIPHPYTESDLIQWLHGCTSGWEDRTAFVFAIRKPGSEQLMGAAGLHVHPRYGYGELGFWMGGPYRRRGYVREAVSALIDYGFRNLQIQRIHAIHRADNEGSGRVLMANGLRREATLDQFLMKDGRAWDVIQYRLLRQEWEMARTDG